MPRTSPEMAAKLKDEHAAILEIRRLYPSVPQKTLARQIRDHNFPLSDNDATLAGLLQRVGYRHFYSTYSVIRRFDKARKAAAAAALA